MVANMPRLRDFTWQQGAWKKDKSFCSFVVAVFLD